MRVYEKRVLRKIFGLRKDEVTGSGEGCRKGTFMILYPSPNI